MIDVSKYNIIDLTLPLNESIRGYDYEIARTVVKDGWNAGTIHLYSHSGTHMDAPYHFEVSNETIDQFTPDQLVVTAWVVNIAIQQNQQLLTIADLGTVADDFVIGDSLLLRTNWHKTLADYDKYRNQLPRISEELANWCVEKKVNILGVEPPSVADVNNLEEVTHIHHILLKGSVIIVEGLAYLDKIRAEKVTLIALPLKIAGGDGAPARVIALEQRKI
ncbi:MAG: cyclase family protein [Bacteroidota bacterium]